MRTLTAILLALSLAVPAEAKGLTVTATPTLVRWTGADAGCVYWIGPGGERVRLRCAYATEVALPPGLLYPGDTVEVRRPTPPSGALTGRATVKE